MGFTLRVTFSGLCLFVPDPTNGKMYVLMPKTTHGGGGPGHEPHAARLIFDIGHLNSTNPRRTGILAHALLEDFELDLSRFTGGFDPTLPPSLVSVGKLAGNKRIRRNQLEGDRPPGSKFISRVKLAGGGCTDHDPGGYWEIGDERTCMTFTLEWSIDSGAQTDLTLTRKNLDDLQDETDLPTLFPFSAGGAQFIDLLVYHVTEGDLPPVNIPPPPPDPLPGHEAKHFLMFRDVFDQPGAFNAPKLIQKECPQQIVDDLNVLSTAERSATGRLATNSFFGSFYTCMMAQADPE